MRYLVFTACALVALGAPIRASGAMQPGSVLAQSGPSQAPSSPDANGDRSSDRDGEIRRFNREERGEPPDDGEDRREGRDDRRRDREEHGGWEHEQGRDRDPWKAWLATRDELRLQVPARWSGKLQ